MNKAVKHAVLATTLVVVAGCFDEPTPAYKTVPEGARQYFSDKGLKDVDKTIASLDAAKVEYLNFDRNQITNVAGVAKFTNLKWLRLNNNRLASLPDLKALVNLRRLYLKDNALTAVPETIKDLPALTDIELSGNPIKEIPDWLAQKQGLKNVSLNRTQITKLPADLSAWQSLQTLQLGDLRFSAEEMARVRKALPSVAIVF